MNNYKTTPLVLLNKDNFNIEKEYESIQKLANEYNLNGGTIYNYIKRKTVFKNKYFIVKKEDLSPNFEANEKWFNEKILINQYNMDGTYINTYKSFKEVVIYLRTIYPDKKINYINLKQAFENGTPYLKFMFKKFEDNKECINIDPYEKDLSKYGAKRVLEYDYTGKLIRKFRSIREITRKTKICYITINKILNSEITDYKGYTFRFEDEDEDIKIMNNKDSISKSDFDFHDKEEIFKSNLSFELKNKLYKFLEY